MKILVGLFICTALLATAQEPAAVLAFKNPGFEEGIKNPDGWTVTSEDPSLKVSWGFETNHPFSGKRSFQLQADGCAGTVSLSSAKIPVSNGMYLVRFRARLESDTGETHFSTTLMPSKSAFPNDPLRKPTVKGRLGLRADDQWTLVESEILVWGGADTLSVTFSGMLNKKGAFSICLDDFEVVKISKSTYRHEDPATAVLPPLEPALQALASRTQAQGEVRELDGRPRMVFDGLAVPPTYYLAHFAKYEEISTNASSLVPPIKDFKEAGVGIYSPLIRLPAVWTGKNEFDYSAIEKVLMNHLRIDPDGKLIVRLMIFPYVKWAEENPDEVTCDENGLKVIVKGSHPVACGRPLQKGEGYAPSYYSSKYREDTADAVRAIVKHIQSLPAGKAVVGYSVTGGNDITFRPYSVGMSKNLPDYSPAARASFRTYLKEIYKGDVEQLRKAWASPALTFETAQIPSQARRQTGNFFLSERTDKDIVDYESFLTDELAALREYYAEVIRKTVDHPVVISTYNVGTDQLSLGRMLKSSQFDYYHCFPISGDGIRFPGGITASITAMGSIALHQKIFVTEQDSRTWLSPTETFGFELCAWAKNAEEYIAMTKRESGMMLAAGHGEYWFDQNGGWFRDDELMKGIAGIQQAFKADLNCTEKPYAEVALFIDEKSPLYISPKLRRGWLVKTYKQLVEFNKSGVPYQFYLQEDLANPKLPDYKAYIFLNAYHLSAAERHAIDTLKAAGKTICFLHAPNVIGAKSPAEGISEITGMQVAPADDRLLLAIPSGAIDTTFGKYGEIASISGNTFTGPGFSVTDTNATIIGEYPDGKAAAAWIQSGKSKILFCGSPELKAGFINRLARWAGAWVAAEPGDGVFVNRRWLTIHAVTDGEKTITLAAPSCVVDFTTGKEISKETQTVVVSMKRGETRWFALTPKSGATSLPTNP